jgi:hypothetical protein
LPDGHIDRPAGASIRIFQLDTAAFAADNRRRHRSSRDQQMRTASALITAATLAAALPAQAYERWPVIPPEQGISPVARPAPLPWRCADEPVFNFYHGAYYLEPPAVYLGNTYRPFYRYAAWQRVPRTYVCAER